MAKSDPKQSSFRPQVRVSGWARNAVLMFSLLALLTGIVLVFGNRFPPDGARILVGHHQPSAPGADSPLLSNAGAAAPELVEDHSRFQPLAAALAKRYRVSQEAMLEFVAAAFDAAGRTKLDPMLILAVAAVESRFNPIAESVMGAKGLMQVIPSMHPEKFENARNDSEVLDPETNIKVGAQVIHEYLGRAGSLTAALQMYAGAANDSENQYAVKVLSERDRLHDVARSVKLRPAQSSQGVAATL